MEKVPRFLLRGSHSAVVLVFLATAALTMMEAYAADSHDTHPSFAYHNSHNAYVTDVSSGEEAIHISLSFSPIWIKVCGICGILGALCMFIGDMLFYFETAPNRAVSMSMRVQPKLPLMRITGDIADWRLKLSAVSGMLSAWLYLLGSFQVLYAFLPIISDHTSAGPCQWYERYVLFAGFISMAFIGVGYGVVHAHYCLGMPSRRARDGTGKKHSPASPDTVAHQQKVAAEGNNALRLLLYPFAVLLSVLWVVYIPTGRTRYHPFMVCACPAVLLLLQSPLFSLMQLFRQKDPGSSFFSYELFIIVIGGYFNHVKLLLYLLSTINLW